MNMYAAQSSLRLLLDQPPYSIGYTRNLACNVTGRPLLFHYAL